MTSFSRVLTACVAAAALLSACSSAGATERAPRQVTVQAPERDTITVGFVPSAEAAPLFLARSEGYFEEEGLTVKPLAIVGGGAAIPAMLAGRLDLAQADYVAAFLARSRDLPIDVTGEMHRAAPGAYGLVVPARSPIRKVAQLKEKKVAVNVLVGTAQLTIDATLRGHGLSSEALVLRETPFPDMTAVLKEGTADAAWLPEPFLSAGLKSGALRLLADPMTGPAAGLPTAGWMTSATWRTANPRTLAAFQRALAKAQRLAAADRKKVASILPTYIRVPASAAARAALGAYPARTDTRRLQRVADLMLDLKYLRERLDVKTFAAAG
ncbi:ABC transporter substrate-binding protein [Nonomuraea terrae]|uniref:ABC transporter substrate-binding protein n=1 Tax=Nonomuraea terrae TaxID=2530383 RepID=UPI001404BC1F|nr:ABC transporter substrate-binding protein [Nonomuraea terrae]